MAPLDDLSEGAVALMFDALDHGVDNAGTDAAGFIPFAFVDRADRGREAVRFVAGDLGDVDLAASVAAGREQLRVVDEAVVTVALVWDGYLTLDGQRSEAVFMEGYEVGSPTGVLLAQRYRRDGDAVVPEGNPVFCGSPEPLVQARRTGDAPA